MYQRRAFYGNIVEIDFLRVWNYFGLYFSQVWNDALNLNTNHFTEWICFGLLYSLSIDGEAVNYSIWKSACPFMNSLVIGSSFMTDQNRLKKARTVTPSSRPLGMGLNSGHFKNTFSSDSQLRIGRFTFNTNVYSQAIEKEQHRPFTKNQQVYSNWFHFHLSL